MKILYELNNNQRLVEVHKSGAASSSAVVLWHEGEDGPFPANLTESVGGLERSGNQLVVNAQKLAAHQAAIAAAATADGARSTRVNQAKQLLRASDFSAPMNVAQLTSVCRALVILLKDLDNKL